MNQQADPRMQEPYWGYPGSPGFMPSSPDIFASVTPCDVDPEVEEAVDWQSEYLRVTRAPPSDSPPPTIMVPESQSASIDITTPPRQVITDVPEPERPTPPNRHRVVFSTSPVDVRAAAMLGIRYERKKSRFRPPGLARPASSPPPNYRAILDSFNNRCRDREAEEPEEVRNEALREIIVYLAERQLRPSDRPPLPIFDTVVRSMTIKPEQLREIIDTIDRRQNRAIGSLMRVLKRWVIERYLYNQELATIQPPSS